MAETDIWKQLGKYEPLIRILYCSLILKTWRKKQRHFVGGLGPQMMKLESLGPKTRETELRLGISFDGGSNGVGPGETRSLLKQRINGGFGNKRWFSETGGGFEPPWRSPEKRVAEPPSAVAPRAPAVVGWPPVRAFRRNMVLQPKPEMDSKVTADGGDAPLPQAPTKAAEEQMYVKVNMEGYAVGRKINLRAHNGYDSLSCALQRMFNNFFSMTCSDHEQISEEDEEFKSDYVLIYEDNEGDRLLVGDVPWEFSITTTAGCSSTRLKGCTS